MALRWKKNPHETGLRAIGAGPRGSKLHDGAQTYAIRRGIPEKLGGFGLLVVVALFRITTLAAARA